jgi:kynurenine formamidase
MDVHDLHGLADHLRNWGRWGEEDEAGTVNFITATAIVKAARLVRRGVVFSLALPFDRHLPLSTVPGSRRFPPIHLMLTSGADAAAGGQDHLKVVRYADDVVMMPLQCGTQWDGLAHNFDRGKMYNGWPAEMVDGAGASRNGIENLADRVVGRGVLLDVASHHEVDALEPGTAVCQSDLHSCAAAQNVSLESGDFVLVRTGHLGARRGSWDDFSGGPAPGLALDTLEWIFETQLAGIATDTWGAEVIPNETPDVFQPFHIVAIPNMGLLIGEMFDLDALADDCSADGRYEFLFVAPPLPFPGAVGSPVNPIAIK